MARLTATFILALICTLSTAAQTPGTTAARATKPSGTEAAQAKTDSTTRGNDITVVLKSSRPQAASDKSFSITAEIENVSSTPVFLNENKISLLLPTELNPSDPSDAPQQQFSDESLGSLPATSDDQIKIGTLQPGSRTVAFFKITKPREWWTRFMASLGFIPADYTFRVVCKYWKNQADAEQAKSNYATQVAEITIPVVAPQSAILVGSALGGLMAFVLLPSLWMPVNKKFEECTRRHQLFIVLRGLTVSALLSVMVAILLSRVSDSQFLIRVTVQDFWGAVTIGFVAGASGTSVLQRFNLSQAQKLKTVTAAPVQTVAEAPTVPPVQQPVASFPATVQPVPVLQRQRITAEPTAEDKEKEKMEAAHV